MPSGQATQSDVPEISHTELRENLKAGSIVLVDVLPAESYSIGHIPSAINLPLEGIAKRARDVLPARNAAIVVYCAKFT